MLGQFAAIAALNLRNAVLLQHVQDLAERDSLTGAANRRMFQLALERVLGAEGTPARRTRSRRSCSSTSTTSRSSTTRSATPPATRCWSR